jgi:3-methyladenine DNA glycosylase AlkD
MKRSSPTSARRNENRSWISPKKLAEEALVALKRKADPKRAEGAQKYFKEAVKVLGLAAADSRALAESLYQKVKGRWSIDQAVELADILLLSPYLEAKHQAIHVLGRFMRGARPEHFPKMRSWFEADLLDNWASTDVFCGEVLTPFLEKYPEFGTKLKGWTKAKNMWVRRASAVALVTPARHGESLDLAYGVAGRLRDNKEDLMHKACGWLLREAGKTDMPRLEKYLLKNGPKIPRTTVRYAIERFEAKKRKYLLQATRPQPGVPFS